MNERAKKYLNELIDEASRLYPLHNDLATRAYLDRIIDLARMAKVTEDDEQEPPKEATGREVRKQCIKYPGCVTIQYEKMGRKVVGVINRTDESLTDEGYPYKYYADVYLDDMHVFAIEECKLGIDKLHSIARAACYQTLMKATHKMRYRQNRKHKKGGVK